MPDVAVGLRSGYLAVPAASRGPWPGVVVIHEAFGLNRDIRGHADRLAALGYLALAPDLYDGRSWVRCIRSAVRQLHAPLAREVVADQVARGAASHDRL